jgi:uncharacterized protein (DUF2342 family)
LADGLLLHDTHIFVPNTTDLRTRVLDLIHVVGHEGIQKTLQCLRAEFYIPHDKRLVQDHVWACAMCQRNKTQTLQPAGLLQPLEVSSQV